MPRLAFSDPSIGSITTWIGRRRRGSRRARAPPTPPSAARPNASSSAKIASSTARSMISAMSPPSPRPVFCGTARSRGVARRATARELGAARGRGPSQSALLRVSAVGPIGRRILGTDAGPRRRPERSTARGRHPPRRSAARRGRRGHRARRARWSSASPGSSSQGHAARGDPRADVLARRGGRLPRAARGARRPPARGAARRRLPHASASGCCATRRSRPGLDPFFSPASRRPTGSPCCSSGSTS